ncbi:hypothetical protein B0H13DRAFT_2369885 [Mycena leptocephala]|nr:hypothetical protein B0H13DRAFT_2369885 [Mycena leptocephala]
MLAVHFVGQAHVILPSASLTDRGREETSGWVRKAAIAKIGGPNALACIDIDREGWEFATLTAIIESFKGKPLPFEQMQIEIHRNYEPDHITTVGAFDKWCTTLEDAGLRPF